MRTSAFNTCQAQQQREPYIILLLWCMQILTQPLLHCCDGRCWVLAAVCSELQGDGIDTSLILRAAGHPSPFTYIIVDREGELLTAVAAASLTADTQNQSLKIVRSVFSDVALGASGLMAGMLP
jgi:hypothetical protein